jgi:hypothetical protein
MSDDLENNLLKLIFNATAWANYADNAASAPQTNIHVALHTGDPGDAGNMSTSEANYTSYARVNTARTAGGWTVTGNSVSPASMISFPTGTGGAGTLMFWSTGKTGGGATPILFTGALAPNVVSGTGVTPQLTTATTITLD